MTCCTWVDCSHIAVSPQTSAGSVWADLCEVHAREIDAAFDLGPKEILSTWVKAQGGAKAAAERMFRL